MSSPPLIVYGVVNLFLVIVALLGLLALFRVRETATVLLFVFIYACDILTTLATLATE